MGQDTECGGYWAVKKPDGEGRERAGRRSLACKKRIQHYRVEVEPCTKRGDGMAGLNTLGPTAIAAIHFYRLCSTVQIATDGKEGVHTHLMLTTVKSSSLAPPSPPCSWKNTGTKILHEEGKIIVHFLPMFFSRDMSCLTLSLGRLAPGGRACAPRRRVPAVCSRAWAAPGAPAPASSRGRGARRRRSPPECLEE